MVDCTLLLGMVLLERLEFCVVDVDMSAIGKFTLLVLVILTSLLLELLSMHVLSCKYVVGISVFGMCSSQ